MERTVETSGPSARPAGHLHYRPEIDGLRAVAVLAVLLFHFELGPVPGGFVGVDIFFVISGFLISSIIQKDLEQGRFSLAGFWERRIRRIVPALTVVILATFAAGAFLLMPADFERLGVWVAAQSAWAVNIVAWKNIGYFQEQAEMVPLLHTWSLAVEEQFYLLFPLLFCFAAGRVRNRLRGLMLLAFIVSLALSLYGTWHHSRATFYLLPTRAWELLLGVLISLAGRPAQKSFLMEWSSGCGVVLMVLSFLVLDAQTPFPGYAALLPVCGAGLFIWSNGAGRTMAGKLLSVGPLVLIGLISYSLYLWHWPLLVLGRYWALEPLSELDRITLLIISVGLALVSWRFVERPFRQKSIPRKTIFAAGVGALVVFAAIGLIASRLKGIPARMPAEVLVYDAVGRERPMIGEVLLDQVKNGAVPRVGLTNGPVRLMIWGDSHAMAILPVLDDLLREAELAGEVATYSATPPLAGFSREREFGLNEKTPEYSEAVLKHVKEKGIKQVLLAAVWPHYPARIGKAHESGEFDEQLKITTTRLQELAATVWVFKCVPMHPYEIPKGYARAALFRRAVPEALSVAEHEAYNAQVNPALDELAKSGVRLLDPLPYLSKDGRCVVEENGRLLYRDRAHLTVEGARKLRRLFEPMVQTARRE